jgi:hypothetical protein
MNVLRDRSCGYRNRQCHILHQYKNIIKMSFAIVAAATEIGNLTSYTSTKTLLISVDLLVPSGCRSNSIYELVQDASSRLLPSIDSVIILVLARGLDSAGKCGDRRSLGVRFAWYFREVL